MMSPYQVKHELLTFGNSEFEIRSLLDRQQYWDPDGEAERANVAAAMWPIFGQVWPAGLFLAELMSSFPSKGKRILEVGCGLALASLVLQRLGADISSTDQHPLAEGFLQKNLALNQLSPIPFQVGSWVDCDLGVEKFDLIIGSDLLYEADQPSPLAAFIERHAMRTAEVIIVDPGRGNHGKFSKAMTKEGFSRHTDWSDQQNIRQTLAKGVLLNYSRTHQEMKDV